MNLIGWLVIFSTAKFNTCMCWVFLFGIGHTASKNIARIFLDKNSPSKVVGYVGFSFVFGDFPGWLEYGLP